MDKNGFGRKISVKHIPYLYHLKVKKNGVQVLYKDENLPDVIFVLLQHRAAVAYGCLFSDLQDICNTYTQVADRANVLYLRR